MLGKYLVVSLMLAVATCYAGPASFVNKCAAEDTKCITAQGQKGIPIFAAGIPELGVKPMDPLHIDHIDASSNNLKFILKDITSTGIKNCNAEEIRRDAAKNKIFLKILCDTQLDGQYEMDGQLLVLHIKGNGPIHVTLRKTLFNVEVQLEEKVGKDGKTHWNIKRWKHTFELMDKSDVKFEGLLDGNDVIGQAAKDLIENNGNDVVLEIGPPVISNILTTVIQNINKFFHKIPLDELV